MPDPQLTAPLPDLKAAYQPGITSPAWPPEPPADTDPEIYADQYAGQIDRQRFCHILFADVTAANSAELKELLTKLTGFAHDQMDRPPVQSERQLDATVPNRRVSIAVGFGASLFTTRHGDDRFGLAAMRPRHLRIIPKIMGDEAFDPAHEVSDLIIIVASDEMYVNEFIFDWIFNDGVHPAITVRRLERGYSRPDSREPSGFVDGISNPKIGAPTEAAEDFVYVHPGDDEPDWCHHGTYLAYRKIRRGLGDFFKLSETDQAAVFGVDPETGIRIGGAPAAAHAEKMNPRRPGHSDLFGIADTDRRFLRRPYFFDEGLDPRGEEIRGVHHLSFVRQLTEQYEWPVLMWQTNPDFPHHGAGIDELYEKGGATNLTAGYYFMPAAAADGSYIGAGLIEG
jgi:deferrochelatase/peroxidase EfeB